MTKGIEEGQVISALNAVSGGLICWTPSALVSTRGLMMKFPSGSCVSQPEFSTGLQSANVVFACVGEGWKSRVSLVLGGFLGAAPIYSNPVAGGRRHYPARLAGGGRL